jgi:hypothetical protein
LRKVLITLVVTGCLTLPAVCQSAPKYQVATILAVERARDASDASSQSQSYDVSVQVDGTVYVVRYKDPHNFSSVAYAVGGNVLVYIGEGTIKYNDILGVSHEVPIVSRRLAQVSHALTE